MPNHIDNHVIITAPEQVLEDIRRFFTGGFDFNDLIPMPTELDIPDGSSGRIGYDILYGDWRTVASYRWTPDAASRERLVAWFERKDPEVLMLGRRFRENEEKHGYRTWYDWRIAHWGTKWNAYKFKLVDTGDPFEVSFMTAWDPPHPVIEALSARFPAAVVWHVYEHGETLVSELRRYGNGRLHTLIGTGGILDFARMLALKETRRVPA